MQQRIHDEVARLDGPPKAADLPRLEFTKTVVEESLRLYPAAWELFGRQVTNAFRLGEYDIPAGSLILIAPILTHRDPRFFPQPLAFDPDRFSATRRGSIDPYAYIPFGVGPHTCLGKSMTLVQMPLIIASLLYRYSVEPVDPAAKKPRPKPRVSLRPNPDPVLQFTIRAPIGTADTRSEHQLAQPT